MLEVVDSEDEEVEQTEEAKPKAKKKGKNSPAPGRKDRSATPDVSVGGWWGCRQRNIGWLDWG